jgi:hypothetical protein
VKHDGKVPHCKRLALGVTSFNCVSGVQRDPDEKKARLLFYTESRAEGKNFKADN